jgi:hypothetical protein
MMKPNIAFLRKVADGKVRAVASYSMKRGRYDYFIGGEITARKHADAGYIQMPAHCRVMESKKATLTELGRAALRDAVKA